MSLEAPFAAQDVFEQKLAPIARFIERPVVGTHHRFDLGLSDQFFESRQVSIVKFTSSNDGVEGVAVFFRAGMHRIMLGAGCRFEIPGMVALKSLDKL